MTMDLMYGCSSEYDPSLEELLEVDLRSEMDRIIAAANAHPFEFMEFEFSSSHFRLPHADEFEDFMDTGKFDPFSLNSSFGLLHSPSTTPIKKDPAENTNAKNTVAAVTPIKSSENGKTVKTPVPSKKIVTNGNAGKIGVANGVKLNPTQIAKNGVTNGTGGLKSNGGTVNNSSQKIVSNVQAAKTAGQMKTVNGTLKGVCKVTNGATKTPQAIKSNPTPSKVTNSNGTKANESPVPKLISNGAAPEASNGPSAGAKVHTGPVVATVGSLSMSRIGKSDDSLGKLEMVQKMADEGKLVLEDGKLVFRNLDDQTDDGDDYGLVETMKDAVTVTKVDPAENSALLEIPAPPPKSVTYTFCNKDIEAQEEMEKTVAPSFDLENGYAIDSEGFVVPLAVARAPGRHRKQIISKVDPAKIVPVSVVSASSASESESEMTEFPTDDESETELKTNNATKTVWVVPRQRAGPQNSNDLHEYGLDEPEFIVTTGTEDVPPPKKKKQKHEPKPHTDGKIYPKPAFSYSCLIAMSLKNSKTGCLPVSEIYKFMCDHFPYFKSAPSGWKNSVRHNLSLNKCFEKIEKPGNGARKGCLWALNPAKIHKMDEEVQKWSKKDPLAIKRAMSDPENLELIERGELKRDYSGTGSDEDDEDDMLEPATPSNQLLGRRSHGNASNSLGAETTMSSTTPASKISQIAINRPADQKIHVKSEAMEGVDFGTITNVQGNYLCHTAGNGTYTLSFSQLNNATTPIIIRRTTVK